MKAALSIILLVLLDIFRVSLIFGIVHDVQKFRDERKKKKELEDRLANTKYPYLAFNAVTEHYGYSYESVLGKFKYIIWYHENGIPLHSVIKIYKKSRSYVKAMCKQLEENFRLPPKEGTDDGV